MGVGMLTLSYIIGVQVGKRGLTHNRLKPSSIDDELKEFAEPLDVQINIFKTIESSNPKTPEARPKADATPQQPARQATPPEAPAAAKPVQTAERFTAQVGAFRDMDSARRTVERLKAQGFTAKIVSADGLHRVQLDWSVARAELDSRMPRLRNLGYSPSAVRVQ
jgi:cell division protein FtsN